LSRAEEHRKRADARQNRARILRAAKEAFDRSGDASLNSIAKSAGVGAGTLYRHFPTREALILAVYRKGIEEVVDAVPALLAEREPLDALRVWFVRLAGYVRVKHGLGEALNTATAQKTIDDSYPPVLAAIARLLEACEAAGVIPPGLDPADVLLLMGFLWRVPANRQADRVLEVVLAGLRATPSATPAAIATTRGRTSRSGPQPSF
jgi:AcrR family transcriptional regulator